MYSRRGWLTWILAGACAGISVWAEPGAVIFASDLTELSLEELMALPVSSASKYPQAACEAPSAVTTVTADDIKRHGYRTLAEVLNSVNGFYTTSDRNYTTIGVRGFARPGDYNTRILLLINGVPQNENIYGSSFYDYSFPVDVDLIDRVEVVRGPGSSLYGTSAFFAVINVKTRSGSDMDGPEVSAEAATDDAYKARFSYGDKLESGLEVLVSGTIFNSEGQEQYYPEYDAPETGNGWTSEATDEESFNNVFFSLAQKPLSVTALYSERWKHVPTGAYGVIFGDPRTRSLDEHGMLDVKYEDDLAEDWHLMSRLSYNSYAYSGRYAYEGEEAGSSYVEDDTSFGSWLNGEIMLRTEALPRNRLTAGMEVKESLEERGKSTFEDYYEPVDYGVDDTQGSVALYGQDEITITSQILLNAGLRYDHYETFGGEWSPRAGLILFPWQGTTAKLLYGEAFRAPNLYESSPSFSYQANPDLDPETIATYEAVLEQTFTPVLMGTLSVFHYRIDGLITTMEQSEGVYMFENVDQTTADGIEVGLRARLKSGVEGQAGYTYTDARDEATDEQLSNSPEHLAKLAASAPLFTDRLMGGGELQYAGRRTTLAGTATDDVLLLNLTLLARGWIQGWEFSANVYNVLDEEYSDPSFTEYILQDQIPQDGRTARLKVTCRF